MNRAKNPGRLGEKLRVYCMASLVPTSEIAPLAIRAFSEDLTLVSQQKIGRHWTGKLFDPLNRVCQRASGIDSP